MNDPRVHALAKILVHHSTRVQEGEVVSIEGDAAASPLLLAVYEQVLEAGGLPYVTTALAGQAEQLLERGSDEQLEWVSPTTRFNLEKADVRIAVQAPQNTRELSGVDPQRQKLRQQAMAPVVRTFMERSAAGDLRWVGTNYPTQALAAEADMSLRRYEDMFFAACLADRPDPLDAWRRQAAETVRLSEWIDGHEQVHILGEGTDLEMSIAGRRFIAGDGSSNVPDGEFFTGPVEDSAEGVISFHLPAVHHGRDVTGVTLRFKDGKVIDATAERGEEYLHSVLDTDPGARFLGELGIGCNYGIQHGTRSILMDEKIGGTVHLAIGASYPETGGVNDSAVHWDMICDLRRGGRLLVDGKEFQVDGTFVV